MRIEFKSSTSLPPRWRVDLAECLEALGHEIVLGHEVGLAQATLAQQAVSARRTAPNDKAAGAGLSILVRLERLLYGVALPLRSEPVAWPARLPKSRQSRDLVIDFDGEAQGLAGDAASLIPLYDGKPGEAAAMLAILDGRAPLLSISLRRPGDGGARPVATALPALEEPRIFTLSLERVLRQMGALIERTVESLAAGGLDAEEPPVSLLPPSPMPGAIGACAFLAKSLKGKIADRLTRLAAHQNHWRIGWRWTRGDEISSHLALPSASYSFLADDARRFYADPFVLWRGGLAHVFCEEFPYATGKGVISVFTIGRDGAATRPRIVLERPYHLSYPMLFEREGQVFMIPETSANRTVEIYRAMRFPDQWVLESTLLRDVSAADATLLEQDGRLWLFAALAETGGSSWDTLGLFHATKLMGPWTPHAANPVLVDAGSARPGGMMFERDGTLIRPAQDCRGGYGSALSLCRVDRLDPMHYAQTVMARLAPRPNWAAEGMHTLNAAGGLEVIDCVGWRPRRA
jgi:hypothetical protein